MKIIGSHNSCSSYKIKQWYLRLFDWMARCQDKGIEEQYNSGVRCFDLRVRFNEFGTPYICHGVMEYKCDIYDVLCYLNSKKCLYVRLGLESEYKGEQKKFFDMFIENCKATYNNILFQFCYKQPNWTIIENNFSCNFIEAQTVPDWKTIIKGPRGLLDKQEERLKELEKYSGIVLQDFV